MDETKDKIILAVKKAITNRAEVVDCDYDIIEIDCNDVDHIAEQVADALIAAGIGDVTEWKEKVECAKRILQIPTLPNGATDLSYFEYKGERIQDIVHQRDEYKHRTEVVERALLDCIKDSRPAHCSIAVCSKWTRCGDDTCAETRRALFIEQAEREQGGEND